MVIFFKNIHSLAVRSSCRREDTASSSSAGAFLSILNVDASDKEALTDAINRVIASYGDEASPDDQVLIQPMIQNIVVSGVIMTRVLTDGTPYYVINYDDESGKTDTITGGHSVSKTVFVYRGVRDQDFDSPRLCSFVALARRLEELCESDALDIEFCLDADNVLHLLQVRPMCTQQHWNKTDSTAEIIGHVAEFIAAKTGPAPELFGRRSILGVMPDWNPAEMIGILPRPLASSLYRNLITSRVWSTARRRMGYKAVPATELMLLIMGRPYIDVRASFNSFLPEELDPVTCEALVSAWLERLEEQPQLHDKVEFEIAQTVLDFCFDQHLDERYPGLLTASRRKAFRDSLFNLTQRCLDISSIGSMSNAFDAVTELRNRQAGRPLVTSAQSLPLSVIASLLEECRKYGTLPFSILARHGFIAESLLRTAAKRGAISPERVQEFKLSITTISGELSREFMEVCKGSRDPLGFMQKYGHLRPGSYDILSPRYADRENLFGEAQALSLTEQRPHTFELTSAEKRDLANLLMESGLAVTPENLLLYARQAIMGRELAKFVFSRNLSDVLESIAVWGQSLGFDREALSFLDIHALLDQFTSALPEKPQEYFARQIAQNREMCEKARHIKLGYLIRSVRDVYVVPQHRAAPNFIGTSQARGEVVQLFADSPCNTDLTGKMVCIENADPGFDWIFTRNIAALITKFGGTNSHMAIRCAEYGLPAAIGVGEQLFATVSAATSVVLDPQAAILTAE